MNWETYKTLTPELKEEYNFRFDSKLYQFIYDFRTMVNNVGGLLLVLMICMFLVHINEDFSSLKPVIMLLSKILVPLTAIFLIAIAITLIISFFTELNWMKKNKIKRVGFGWKN